MPKKKKKEGICEVEYLAGTSGRQDTSSTVLIAANACGMQRPSVSPHRAQRHSHVIMPPFVAAIVVVPVVAKFMCAAGRQATHRLWLCILPHRCQSMCVSVCLPQTRRWTRVCVNAQTYNNCSGYKEIQPHLASLICRIASKFEIKCLLCCQSSLPLCHTSVAHKSSTAFHFPAHLAAQFQPRSQIGQKETEKKTGKIRLNDEAKR